MMAAALVRGEVPDTDCSVCHEPFKEPKILPCGHVVCRHCLVSWIRTQPQAGCPLCRCAIFKTDGEPGSLEDEVEALPTDLALAELVEARALLFKDHTCCVCDDVAATALCLHCGDMLCGSCRKAHEKMTTTKHHKVEDLSFMTPESLAASRSTACSGHPHEVSRLFCPTHGMSVCFQCATAEHKPCPDMQDAEERTEEARAVLAEMAASLTASESEIRNAIQRLERHIKDTDDRVLAAVTHIQKTCDRFESLIKNCRTRMTDLARDEGSDIKETAQAAITILQERKCRVTSHTLIARRAEAGMRHVTDMISVLETRLKELDLSAILPANAKVVSRLEFVTEDSAPSRMEEAFEELCRVRLVRELAIHQTGAFTIHEKHGPRIAQSNGSQNATTCKEGRVDEDGLVVSCESLTAKVLYERQAGAFSFHEKRGPRIFLSKRCQTATCKEGRSDNDGMVVSRETLTTNVLYEVRLGKGFGGWMAVGVLTDSPDIVTLTGESDHLLPATVVSSCGVKELGIKGYVDHPLSSVMEKLGQGDRVGVSLDSANDLHLHVNGEDRGVWAKHVTGLCHALLDLGGKAEGVIQVTALPPTPLEG